MRDTMSKHTIDEVMRLGKSPLQRDRTAYEKIIKGLSRNVDTRFGGWNPAGGEADDVDLHDMVDDVKELPRVHGAGRIAVVTLPTYITVGNVAHRAMQRRVYVGGKYGGGHYWRWYSVLEDAPVLPARANPGAKRRTPAILRHCVAKVAPKRGVPGAYAICTASLQRAGVMRGGKLTAAGKKRDAGHRKRTPENKTKDAAFERALRKPSRDRRAEADALRVARGIRSDATAKVTRSTPEYPILEVAYSRKLSRRDLARLEREVAKLGWRAWGINERGIAFKPTSVDIE